MTSGPSGPGETWWRRLLRAPVLIGAVVVALVIWFAVANNQKVTVDWFLVETSSPLFLVILLSAVLGAWADRLIRWRRGRRPPADRR
jgi:uncharacterized integral membrane protein